jgi:hypothetical protein
MFGISDQQRKGSIGHPGSVGLLAIQMVDPRFSEASQGFKGKPVGITDHQIVEPGFWVAPRHPGS